MEIVIFFSLIGLLILTIYYASKDINKNKTNNDKDINNFGRFTYREDLLNYHAKVDIPKTNTVISNDKKSYDIVVHFNDAFVYRKTKPLVKIIDGAPYYTDRELLQVIDEAKEAHYKLCDKLGKSPSLDEKKQTLTNLELLNNMKKLNKMFFPGGDENRQTCAKHIDILTGHTLETEECLEIFIYCLTHYTVNNKDYGYVIKNLPIAHPNLKDETAIKQVAAYTFLYTKSNFTPLDVTDPEDMAMLNTFRNELDRQVKATEVNFNKYDENCGLEKDKPLFFKSHNIAKIYLNSLCDESGKQLKIGSRYGYSVDNIPGILDCYSMVYENGEHYGNLYVSGYGSDNCTIVPKGYKHPRLSNIPKQEKAKEVNKTNIEDVKEIIPKEPDISNKNNKIKTINTKIDEVKPQPISSQENDINFCRICGAKLKTDSIYCENVELK